MSSIITSDNPAQRLYNICTVALTGKPNVPTRQAWGQTLDINPDNIPEIYRALGILNELASETKEKIEKIPNIRHESFLEDLPLVQKAISPLNLDNNWSNYSQYLTSGAMKSLQFCADKLAESHSEDIIPREALDDLLARAQELVNAVLEADIDDLLKGLLIDLLEMLRKSIMEYRFRGACGIENALIFFLGAITANYDLYDKEQDKPIIIRVKNFVTEVDVMISAAIHVIALGGMAVPLLKLLAPHK